MYKFNKIKKGNYVNTFYLYLYAVFGDKIVYIFKRELRATGVLCLICFHYLFLLKDNYYPFK